MSKRFSVGNFFKSGTSPTKDEKKSQQTARRSLPPPQRRENAQLIKSRNGKRLTVYLPEMQDAQDRTPLDDRHHGMSPVSATASESSRKADPSLQIEQQQPMVQRNPSQNSLSSSVYPSRKATVTSSVYPDSVPSATTRMASSGTINGTRNPTLLRKRKPPPLAIAGLSATSTTSSAKPELKLQTEHTPVMDNRIVPPSGHYSSMVDGNAEPVSASTLIASPLSFVPVNIETVDAPVRVTRSSPLEQEFTSSDSADNDEHHNSLENDSLNVNPFDNSDDSFSHEAELNGGRALIVGKRQRDHRTSQQLSQDQVLPEESNGESRSHENVDNDYDESIPVIRTHIPSIRETIAGSGSPEFEISKNFSTVAPPRQSDDVTHTHSRTISSVEDITNAIDSFQASHSYIEEEEESEEHTEQHDLSGQHGDLVSLLTFEHNEPHLNLSPEKRSLQVQSDNDSDRSIPAENYQRYHSESESEEDQTKVDDKNQVFLKVADLPQLEPGQTLDDYLKGLERDIANNTIETHPTPIVAPPLHKFKSVNDDSLNSSTSEVFYEAREGSLDPADEINISSKKINFNDMISDDENEVDEEDTIPPPYSSQPSTPIVTSPRKNSFAVHNDREINLDDEIDDTIKTDAASVDDLYPDVDDEDDSDGDEDDSVLQFQAAKSPISEQFSHHISTPEMYQGELGIDLETTPEQGPMDRSHLMVVNGTPDSVNSLDDQAQAPPTIPQIPSISPDREHQILTEFPIYDRREKPAVSPIQHSNVLTPAAPLLKKPLGGSGSRRPVPDFPSGGRRSRGLSTTTAQPELFDHMSHSGLNEMPGKGQSSAYITAVRNGKGGGHSNTAGKIHPSMLPITLKNIDNNKILTKTKSNMLFGVAQPRTRVLAGEMDDNELPDAVQLHSQAMTKAPVHPDAAMIATGEQFRKLAAAAGEMRSRRRSSAASMASVAPQVAALRLFVVNPDE